MAVPQLWFVPIVLLLVACLARGAEVNWRTLPIRSEAEFKQGLPGGESEQWMLDMTRSVSRPDRLYMAHDVGKVWRSDDNGKSWQHAICNGLAVSCAQSVEVDPINADVVMVLAGSAWDRRADDLHGLYRSEDAGLNWKRVLELPGKDGEQGVPHQRYIQRNITWDRTSVTATEARRWYAGVNGRDLYRSEDGAKSWAIVSSLREFGELDAVQAHPTRAGVLYLCTAKGLFQSSDSGGSFTALGDLPEGRVRTIDIDPANPHEIYATVDEKGLYRSRDGGKHFALVRQFDARRVHVHPSRREIIYLAGGPRTNMQVSADGGESWYSPRVVNLPGRPETAGYWKTRIFSHYAIVLPDPREAQSAIVQSSATIYRTEDAGRTFTDSSAGYTGYAWGWFTPSAAFDVENPDRFFLFMKDVGMQATESGGDWFEGRGVPYHFKQQGSIAHTCMNTGSMQPVAGAKVIVATAGIYWQEVLVRSEDEGRTWEIVDGEPAHNLFVAFHTKDVNVVYAHNKRSEDAGKTFAVLPGIPEQAVIVGMAASRPDTVYAMNKERSELYRSDDRGDTWRLYAKPGWRMRGLDSIPTFVISPNDENLVYSVDAQGDLATFDGKTWKSLGVRRMVAEGTRGYVRYLAIDPRHPEIIYASGYDRVFRSTDAGSRWVDISGNLPRLGGTLLVHPLTGDLLWGSIAGTRVLAPPYDSPRAIYHRLK